VTLDHAGDEKTLVRFTLDAEGKVVDVNRQPKSLVATLRNVNPKGGRVDPKTGGGVIDVHD
jgi:hypothetical protein